MNKADIIARVAEKAGITKKDAELAVDATIATITEALAAGDRAQIVGFGSFEVKTRAARQGRNPQTNEPVEIPARKAPVFKPGKDLKAAVN